MENLGSIGYSEEQIELMNVAASFCAEKSPIEKVRTLLEDPQGYDADVWKEIAELGWLAIAIPEAQGGVGLSLGEVVPIVEQMGRRLMTTPFADTTLAAQALVAGGTEAQQEDYLPKIAEGAVATLALAEAHGDWDLHNITASAKADGDKITLSGEKLLVPYAEQAEIIIASVSLDGAPRLVIIPRDAFGDDALRREQIIDETRRTYALKLDGITLPASALLDEAKTKAAFEHIHLTAVLLQAAEMAGGTQAVIDYTLDYLKTRKQFGKTIGEYQALKHPITNAYVDYEKARSHVYSAAHCFNDQGMGEIATRMAKAACDKVYSFAADRAIQFHGGFGFTHDCDAQLYRRAAIWHASQHGDGAWHRAKLADLLF
ncbi:MAG: acyl-CoA dehydrogenase family protein [Pseudomonadota bacterium]